MKETINEQVIKTEKEPEKHEDINSECEDCEFEILRVFLMYNVRKDTIDFYEKNKLSKN